ncbi:MAG: GFA family protein, partial [Hyphomicrobiales bacterium]|nr:GFA family protein [Hyphomicrobiales bacterium]
MQRENRRLAAIVAADIAGYSRLIGVDEEGTLRALRAHRGELIDPLIYDHGGRIANTAGDSLLVEFPSAVDALRCAIAVQEGMTDRNRDLDADRQIRFRIGINIGDVIHDGGDLFGDGVNVAARLEQIAEPGGIFVSGAVREQVAGKIDQDFDDLGHRKVKNIPHLVRFYRVHLVDLPAVDLSAFHISPRREHPLVTGGCMCGKTRFEISEPAIVTIMCHCRMCQVFTSGPYAVWSTFPVEAIRWIEHEPKFFASSPIAVRGSCDKCGTSLI